MILELKFLLSQGGKIWGGSCKKVIEIFKKERYDIIHAHMTDLNWLPLLLSILALTGKKTVRISHSHMNYNTVRLSFSRTLLYQIEGFLGRIVATHYFACGRDAGISLFGKNNVKKEKVTIVHNAFEIENFLYSQNIREEYRKKFSLCDNFVVGNVARFEKQKNHIFLINMFENFCKQYDKSKLLLVGCGSEENIIRSLVHEKNLDDKVIFIGTTNQIEALYQVMDVFVLPSMYEGLATTCIEAQVAGMPVLCSSSISEETKITDLCEFLPINNGVEIWTNKLLKLVHSERKQMCIDEIQKAEYDIRLETNKLENKYISLLDQISN